MLLEHWLPVASARRLLDWAQNDPTQNYIYLGASVFFVLFSGLMSGLTLGLLSMDVMDLEVLVRSGTPREQKYVKKILPILKNNHRLLVTLLLCNAVAMEALPIFLDKLANPVTAIIVSVTAVLFFGEIIPQSVCTRYGLAVGAACARFVVVLMFLASPVAWPMAKLLDVLLGEDHAVLYRRRQLKELLSMHAEEEGLGGGLSREEIQIITGALDLTNKVALRAMTPLSKVFMLSSNDSLSEATLRAVLHSGHSRIPIYRASHRRDVVGLVLVKELLQYRLGVSADVPVAMLRMRSIPRLPATTPLYDMLRLFQTGRSHMAVLTQPPAHILEQLLAQDPSYGRPAPRKPSRPPARQQPDPAPPPTAQHRCQSEADGPDCAAGGCDGSGGGGDFAARSSTDAGGGAAANGTSREEAPRQRDAAAASNSAAAAPLTSAAGLSRFAQAPQPSLSSQPASLTPSPSPSPGQGGGLRHAVEREQADLLSPANSLAGLYGASGGGSLYDPVGDVEERDADAGEPIGIITIEDVIEELIRCEIIDETDRYVDNERSIRVQPAARSMAQGLPPHLSRVLTAINKVKSFRDITRGAQQHSANTSQPGSPYGGGLRAALLSDGGPHDGPV